MVFSARMAKTQTKQWCTTRSQIYALEDSYQTILEARRGGGQGVNFIFCRTTWSLLYGKKSPDFFFFSFCFLKRAKKQMVRAKAETFKEVEDPKTGPAKKPKDKRAL